jgi:MFS family permease
MITGAARDDRYAGGSSGGRHAGHGHSPGVVLRSLVIGLTAFLTVVDLFATQAILPSLTRHYGVTPGAMGFAVNASTIGMALAGLVVGCFSPHIDRRTGILASLLLLAIPTSLLAVAPNLTVSTVLRIMQGLCMALAFTLTLAYLGEQCTRWMLAAPSPPTSRGTLQAISLDVSFRRRRDSPNMDRPPLTPA